MKKLLLGFALMVTAVALTACGLSTTTTSATPVEYSTNTDVFSAEALSATTLMSESSISALSYVPLSSKTGNMMDDEEPAVATSIEDISQYVNLVESFLDTAAPVVQTSDLEDYEYMITYSFTNLAEETLTYKMYYNVIIDTTTDTEEPETTETTTVSSTELAFGNQYQFIDGNEEGIQTSIQGIFTDGTTIFYLEGVEITDGTNQVVRLYSYTDQSNYVKVEYKTDSEDQTEKFFYTVKVDGVVLSSSKVNITTEDGFVNVHLTLVDETSVLRMHFNQKTVDDVIYLNIQYYYDVDGEETDRGSIRLTKTWDEETQSYLYDYQVSSNYCKGQNEYHSNGHRFGNVDKQNQSGKA